MSRSWSRSSLVVVVVLFAVLVPAAAWAAPPTLVLLGSDTLSVSAKENVTTATAYVSILNKGNTDAPITVRFSASSAAGVGVQANPNPAVVAAGDAQRVKVTFTGLTKLKQSVDGELVITGGAVPIARSVSITPASQPAHLWARDFIFGALIVGAVAFLLTALWVRLFCRGPSDGKLSTKAPGPKWDFDSSWATNLTTAGATFGTVLGAVTLPAVPSQIDKDTLIRLNLGFGLLVVVAPFLFHAIRKPSRVSAMDDNGLYGWNVTLLVACCLTFAAVIGELATLALLFWELLGGGGYSWLAVGAVAVAGLLAVSYFVATVPFVASTDWPTLVQQQTQSEEHHVSRISEVLGWLRRERPAVGLPNADDLEEAFRETAPTTSAVPATVAPVRWRIP